MRKCASRRRGHSDRLATAVPIARRIRVLDVDLSQFSGANKESFKCTNRIIYTWGDINDTTTIFVDN
jgi:hypothetical protein